MKYSLGYKRNPDRELPHFTVSAVPLPSKVSTDISMIPVLDQGQQPACVGHAFAAAVMYDYYKKTGKVPSVSPRFIYAQAKKLDGDPNGEGTSAYFAFQGVQKAGGCATTQTVPNNVALSLVDYINVVITDPITQECHQYPLKAEVEIQNPTDAQLKTLLAQYGTCIIAVDVDEVSWMQQEGLVNLKPGNAGGHEVFLHAYDSTVPGDQFTIRNSWNSTWGHGGDGNFLWSDYAGQIYDAMVITIDMNTTPVIPLFSQTLKIGMKGPDVVKLQHILGITEDGNFGPHTLASVELFQTLHGLKPDGIVGKMTEAALANIVPPRQSVPEPVTITRIASDGKETLGTLKAGDFTCSTLELPWLDNQSDISCIPTGTYECVWTFMNDMNTYHYEIQNVPNRSGIFLHNGNYYTNSAGCILLGINPTDINSDGELDVTGSVVTLSHFETIMNQQPFKLVIS